MQGALPNHVDDAGVHRPMEHIQDFTRSHWMPPSVDCLHGIAPAAAMVNEFVKMTQNIKKTPHLLASSYVTIQSLVVYENFGIQNGPSSQLIDATSFVKM